MRSHDMRLAGVPDDLPPEQLERWSNGLVAFLTSDTVPQQFRAWARAQADVLDAHLADAAGFEEDDADEIDDVAGDDEPAVAAPPRRATAARHARPRAREERAFTLRLPAQAGRLAIGILVGVVGLAAVLGIRELTSDDGAQALPGGPEASAFNEARAAELEAILQQDPTNKDALFELGEMNFQAQRYEDMIPWFSKLVEVDPSNTHALTDLGTAAFNLGRPAEAKIWWEKVLAVAPNDIQAHYNLGFMYANAEPRDLAAAVREWETVLSIDPQSQLAQTARVHIDGLKAELAGATAGGAAATPIAATTASAP